MDQVEFNYTELAPDENRETQFLDKILSLSAEDYAPPAPPTNLRVLAHGSRVFVISFPAGFGYDVMHPAPSCQWAVVTSGILELGASDGTVRKFVAGSIINIRDSGSKGHTTRSIGDEPVVMLVAEYD